MVAAARQRQYIYMIAIVLIFSAMWPYNVWLQRRKQEKDLGEATIGQVDTGGFMLKLAMIGGFRGMVANYLWTQARTYEKAPRVGQTQGYGRLHHQAPAPLSFDLDLPGMEPCLQRFRRVGRT